MKNNQNWENANAEAMIEDDQNIQEVADLQDEIVEEDEVTTVTEVADENSEETDDTSVDDSSNADPADEQASEGEESDEDVEEETEDVEPEANEEESTDESESEKTENGYKIRHRVMLITTGIILILLLIWLVSVLFGKQYPNYRGGNNGTGTTVSTTETTDPDDDDKDLVIPGDDVQTTNPTTPNGGTNGTGNNHPTTGNGANGGNNSGDQNGSDDEGGNGGSNGNSGDENGGTDDSNGDTDDGSNEGDDSGKPSGGENGNDDDENDNNDTASDYAGVTNVRISDVNDATGIITITIDGKSVAVPVQTTVFNGRVTKSGVAQGKLDGYNIGVTVMLYYPQEDGFSTNSVEGYMNRTEDSLTVLVDINGNGSKLLIKINGMKALL